jgi:hypothetical protein
VRWPMMVAWSLAGLFASAPSIAHDWYPPERCSNIDCRVLVESKGGLPRKCQRAGSYGMAASLAGPGQGHRRTASFTSVKRCRRQSCASSCLPVALRDGNPVLSRH